MSLQAASYLKTGAACSSDNHGGHCNYQSLYAAAHYSIAAAAPPPAPAGGDMVVPIVHCDPCWMCCWCMHLNVCIALFAVSTIAETEGLAYKPYRCNRAQWIHQLLRLLWERGFVAMKAPPQSGKTSTLQLAAQQIPWLADWATQQAGSRQQVDLYYVSMLGVDTLDEAVARAYPSQFSCWQDLFNSCSSPKATSPTARASSGVL